MPTTFRFFVLLVALVAGGARAAAASSFVDASSYFATVPGMEVFSPQQYRTSVEGLVEQFVEVCGDTLCEGDFANLTTLAIDCSIDAASGAVGACVWTIAGSFAEIDPVTGRVAVTSAVRACDFGINGDAAALARYLDEAGKPGAFGRGLRDVAIPGRSDGRSLFAVLDACL